MYMHIYTSKLTDSPVGTWCFLFLELTASPLDSQDDEGVEFGDEIDGWEVNFAVFTATHSSNFVKRSVIDDSVPCNLLISEEIEDCISDSNV